MAFQGHSGVSSRAGTIPGQLGSQVDVFAKTRPKGPHLRRCQVGAECQEGPI